MKFIAVLACALALSAIQAMAGPADDIAEILASRANSDITPDTLAVDFAHLAKFVRHDAAGQVLFSDGGVADGHVRHAQARFQSAIAGDKDKAKGSSFVIALELIEEPDFSFPIFAAALERRLGTPDQSSNVAGAVLRMWRLKGFAGRTLTVARSQSSDNGDAIAVVQLVQTP